MEYRTIEEALSVLGEASTNWSTREEAHQFLVRTNANIEVPQLVEALCNDNFNVRWQAEKRLSEMGLPALEGILRALVDPKKVGNPRLRNGIYHVLRNHKDAAVRQLTAHLLDDLHGCAADLKSMHEAHRLLQELNRH